MSNFIEMLHATELPAGEPITEESYAAAERAMRTFNETRALVDAMNAQIAQRDLRAMLAELYAKTEPPTQTMH